MKYLILFFVTGMISKSIVAQTADECKYFDVISYLKTNIVINNEIKSYRTIPKAEKNSKYLDFNILPWIEFITFEQFKNEANLDSTGIDREVLMNDQLYYDTYHFEPLKSTLLEKTIERNDAKLFLTFSKVIGNTLLAEILNSDNTPHRIRRMGSGVKLLFVFDQQGMIQRVYTYPVLYN